MKTIKSKLRSTSLSELFFLPNHAGYDDDEKARFKDFIRLCEQGACEGWSCKRTTKLGDVGLFWFDSAVQSLAGIGVCSSEPEREVNDGWDWTDAPTAWFCDYDPLIRLAMPVTKADIVSDQVIAKWWRGRPFYGRPKIIPDVDAATRLTELILEKNPKDRHLARILNQFTKRAEENNGN